MKGFSNRFSYRQSFFHCCSLIKIEKENRTTSPEFKQNMPKPSKITLYNEKRTDIYSYQSYCFLMAALIGFEPIITCFRDM